MKNLCFAAYFAVAALPAVAQSPDPASCIAMDAMTVELNARGGTETVQKIRGIYTIVGLAFGGERTAEKCVAAMVEMGKIDTTDTPSENCEIVATLTSAIVRELEDLGQLDSAQLDRIFLQSGMRIADLNPDGVDNATTCGKAMGPLSAYLDDLSDAGADLRQGFRRTTNINVSRNGQWALSNGDAMTLWSHNGSQMAWEVGPRTDRTVWYWDPRASLSSVGVQRGTLLFEGRREGPNMIGQARIFTETCGVFVYDVRGPISASNTEVILSGTRPVIDANCAITGSRADRLVFNYVADAPPGETFQSIEEEIDDTPGFGVWATQYRVGGVNSGLNLRSRPSSNARIITELPPNAKDIWAIGLGCTPDLDQIAFHDSTPQQKEQILSTRWCNITWNGYDGWVYGQYLRVQN